MPTIGGLNFSYSKLAAMSGLSHSTLFDRYNANHNITLSELLAPPQKIKRGCPRNVVVDGETIPLLEWADMHRANRKDVVYRWRRGIRDANNLIRGLEDTADDEVMPEITRDMLEWLQETKFARSGMVDEWQIACELIGISPEYAESLKEYVEAINDGKRL